MSDFDKVFSDSIVDNNTFDTIFGGEEDDMLESIVMKENLDDLLDEESSEFIKDVVKTDSIENGSKGLGDDLGPGHDSTGAEAPKSADPAEENSILDKVDTVEQKHVIDAAKDVPDQTGVTKNVDPENIEDESEKLKKVDKFEEAFSALMEEEGLDPISIKSEELPPVPAENTDDADAVEANVNANPVATVAPVAAPAVDPVPTADIPVAIAKVPAPDNSVVDPLSGVNAPLGVVKTDVAINDCKLKEFYTDILNFCSENNIDLTESAITEIENSGVFNEAESEEAAEDSELKDLDTEDLIADLEDDEIESIEDDDGEDIDPSFLEDEDEDDLLLNEIIDKD